MENLLYTHFDPDEGSQAKVDEILRTYSQLLGNDSPEESPVNTQRFFKYQNKIQLIDRIAKCIKCLSENGYIKQKHITKLEEEDPFFVRLKTAFGDGQFMQLVREKPYTNVNLELENNREDVSKTTFL